MKEKRKERWKEIGPKTPKPQNPKTPRKCDFLLIFLL
jgi:hypothetical protein